MSLSREINNYYFIHFLEIVNTTLHSKYIPSRLSSEIDLKFVEILGVGRGGKQVKR